MRDRFIDGQAECALRRHLDSLIPDTPMSDIVDSCRVWESHRDVETEPGINSKRQPVYTICQVVVDEQIQTPLPEKESLEEIISKLLPTPGSPCSAINGNISSIDTSSSATISSDRFGDYVSRNSQRGYGGVTEGINSIRRRMFFMRDIDTHDIKLPDSGRVISVPAHWVAGGTCW